MKTYGNLDFDEFIAKLGWPKTGLSVIKRNMIYITNMFNEFVPTTFYWSCHTI